MDRRDQQAGEEIRGLLVDFVIAGDVDPQLDGNAFDRTRRGLPDYVFDIVPDAPSLFRTVIVMKEPLLTVGCHAASIRLTLPTRDA